MTGSLDIQFIILVILGIICLTTSFFTLIINYQSFRKKSALFVIELSTAILLFSDATDITYRGRNTNFAFYAMRISNFLLFFLMCFALAAFNAYICTLIVGRDKLQKLPKRIFVNFILSIIGMVMVIVSQFTNIYYYIDSNNVYHRGALFSISYVMPMLIYLIQFTIIIQYRNLVSKRIFASLILFTIMPVFTSIAQALMYGVTVLTMSIGLAAIVIFCQSLIDQNDTLIKIATEDKMTGLPNSYGFMSQVGRKISLGVLTRYNAYYFDISRMNMINRKYGNDIGDYVICKYAEKLSSQLKSGEVLGRLGGNFFVALIDKEHNEEFLSLLQGIDIPISTTNGEATITISSVAGIYSIENNMMRPETVLSNVAIAVNLAKNVKKKPYVYLTKEIQQELLESRKIMEQLPKAMQNKELKPYYQPKVNSDNNTLIGAEALVRWEQGDEIIPPYRYIPLMEQNESICTFDFYMLDYVCQDIKEWLEAGLEVPVISVNFSRRNLGNPILAEEIYNVVKSHDIPLKHIQIEFTETIDEYPLSYLKGVVEALKNYGLSTAIDDFGIGSASINLLKEIPFDILKIDKSFVDSLNENDQKILKCIIDLATIMNIGVIVEGVEQEQQVAILKELGCYNIQGYYYDKPLQKQIFENRMKNPVYNN